MSMVTLLYCDFVISRILPIVIGALLTVACGRVSGVFPVPEQHSVSLGPDPDSARIFVNMDDPDSDEFIVRDISPGRDFRRWAFAHPELRFKVKEAHHLIFTSEFAIPDVTYKVTGPVSISYAVNGRILGTLHCDRAGDYHLAAPVPDGLVEPEQTIRVNFEANPRWISPEDGAQLSFLLRSAGFKN